MRNISRPSWMMIGLIVILLLLTCGVVCRVQQQTGFASQFYLRYGDLCCTRGDPYQAIASYNQAIEFNPDFAEAYFKQGLVYLDDIHNYDRALASFDRAIELDPDYAKAYYGRGCVHLRMDNYDQALADSDQAIKLDPDYADAYYDRGQVHKIMGNYEQADADFKKAMELGWMWGRYQ